MNRFPIFVILIKGLSNGKDEQYKSTQHNQNDKEKSWSVSFGSTYLLPIDYQLFHEIILEFNFTWNV